MLISPVNLLCSPYLVLAKMFQYLKEDEFLRFFAHKYYSSKNNDYYSGSETGEVIEVVAVLGSASVSAIAAAQSAANAAQSAIDAANNAASVNPAAFATAAQGAKADTALQAAAIGLSIQAYDADIPTTAASQAEMEAGVQAALRSMSPLGVAQAIAALSGNLDLADFTTGQVLADPGSQPFPGGLIFKYGSCTSNTTPVAVSFVSAFPNQVFGVIICRRDGTGTVYDCSANSATVNGFSAHNGSGLMNNFYFALGR